MLGFRISEAIFWGAKNVGLLYQGLHFFFRPCARPVAKAMVCLDRMFWVSWGCYGKRILNNTIQIHSKSIVIHYIYIYRIYHIYQIHVYIYIFIFTVYILNILYQYKSTYRDIQVVPDICNVLALAFLVPQHDECQSPGAIGYRS